MDVVELGTKQFPYKHLGLVFVELLNFHANSDRTINVYLKESTESYLDLGFNYVINITTVNILSYSDGPGSPARATLVGGEVNDPNQMNMSSYFSPGTTFNILQNTELRKDQQMFSRHGLSDTEMSYIRSDKQVILVHISNFSISKIDITTVFKDINSLYDFFFAVYLQFRWFNMTDMDVRTSGIIFMSNDPLSMTIQNIDVEYSRNVGGIILDTFCNYPEAYLEGFVYIDNIALYNEGGFKKVNYRFYDSFRYLGPANISVNRFYSSTSSTDLKTEDH
eukprot:CAMPEP_0168330360 /NCGR_PEP_ID=MMETSP0213-20121227/7683_1 /TAXON_ID=151035 /ORGANISM="Euplotes harpa, Strain FSP1.4" /LENGTH=278 /DNA_ID=CAMNT_0008333913 /DNA_START=452 /DNA_END=1289 /DNA_ORIENTATION=-